MAEPLESEIFVTIYWEAKAAAPDVSDECFDRAALGNDTCHSISDAALANPIRFMGVVRADVELRARDWVEREFAKELTLIHEEQERARLARINSAKTSFGRFVARIRDLYL